MPAVAPQKLSPRLEQIVNLLVQGKSNQEIADELHLSPGTIQCYMQRIFKKLSLPNRTAVAVWAYERNR